MVLFKTWIKLSNFNNNIENTDNFKFFKYHAKLLGNTEAELAPSNADEILKNAKIVVSLKYLSNFWGSLEMPLINWKVELKRKWTKYCVLSANSNDNDSDNDNADNIIFTIKGTQLYVPVVTLSAKDNKKLSGLLSKGFEKSVYWNEYETKTENKNTINKYRYFLESNFVWVHKLFIYIYYFQIGIVNNYNFIINGKNVYDQAIDYDVKLMNKLEN